MLDRKLAIKLVKAFLEELQQNGLVLKKAILFGSAARDDMTEWSDIDLLLVSDNFGLNPFDNIKKYSKINIKYPDIETHAFPTDYFLLSDPFLDEVKKTGIQILP